MAFNIFLRTYQFARIDRVEFSRIEQYCMQNLQFINAIYFVPDVAKMLSDLPGLSYEAVEEMIRQYSDQVEYSVKIKMEQEFQNRFAT